MGASGATGAEEGEPAGHQVGLRPPRHPVDRRAITWWTLRTAGDVLPPLVGILVAAAVLDGARGWLLAAAVAVAGVAAVVVVPRWRHRVHRWETTDEAVYAASGWFVREWRVVPISRIQSVDTRRGPLEQLLGLASVTVTTAAPKAGAGSLVIAGLDHATAVALAEHLTAITEATPGDAT